MAGGYSFDRQSARRIWNAVAKVEKMPQNASDTDGRPVNPDSVLWLPYKNDGSETVPRNGVLRVSGFQTGSFASAPDWYLKCVRPDTTFSRVLAVNSDMAVTAGQHGLCRVPNACRAVYDSGTPAFGESWGYKPSQFTLSKNYPGFVILGVVDAANKVALVRPEEPEFYLGKADAVCAKGSTCTVSVWAGTSGSEADTTMNITSCLAREFPIVSTSIFVRVKFTNGNPEVFPSGSQSFLGKADSAIAKGASGTVSLWAGTPGSESDSTVNQASCYNRTADIASGDWVVVSFMNDQPYVALLECA